MNWHEITKERVGYATGTQEFVSGVLTVTFSLSYLSAPGTEDAEGSHILVQSEDLADKLAEHIPIAVGTMIVFRVSAIAHGTLVQSGLPMFPFFLYDIDSLIIETDDSRKFRIT